MSTLTVNTTPQPIYPFGDQEAFTLTNNGPWTVYLDSDTSVSKEQSIPLPPTASIVWDALRPLFVVSAGASSTLTMTRNTGMIANNRGTFDKLATFRNQTTNPALTGIFECGAYESLTMLLSSDNVWSGLVPDANAYVELFVTWYDKTNTVLSASAYKTFNLYPITTLGNARLVVPVKGDRCSVSVTASGPAADRGSLDVYGSSRNLPSQFDWLYQLTGQTLPAYLPAASFTSADFQDRYWYALGWVNRVAQPIYLNQLGNRITVSIHCTAAVSAAGLFRMRDFISKQVIWEAAIPILAGTGQTVTREWTMPISRPMELHMAVDPTTAGNINVTVQWEDTNA